LAVSGEVLWRVPSLRVDDDMAAIQLFGERARLVQPSFTVNDDNMAAVADLCVRLDGIPLAIELATARLKMLTVGQIAQHLNDRFRLLTGGSRNAVERQRTLRAMMDWSYDLLSDQERALLRRLSVFSDGFTYEAAEEVCSGETLARFEVLDVLGRLVEASVVTFDSDARPRYRLLETVRQYALDKLVDAGEADEVRLRHAEHFRAVSRQIDASLHTSHLLAMEPATDDLGNFRAAMTWASESGEGQLALELACNLRTYFWNRVMYRESFRWLTSALDIVGNAPSPLVPVGTAYALTDAMNIGAGASTLDLAERARKILDQNTDDLARGLLANALANVEMHTGDVRRADNLWGEATLLLRKARDPRWFAPVQNRFLTSWLMNSRESEREILSLVDDAVLEGTPIRARVVRTAFKALAEDYEGVITSTETRNPADEWESTMLLLFRIFAERATGRPEDALESIRKLTAMPGDFADGWRGWHTGMAHLQLGDLDKAIGGFAAPGAYDPDLPTVYDRANVAWFWSIVAGRRDEHP
ncbi:MAG: ATP-binding protein, partial [Acidimicrobiia bacterium]